MEEWRKVADFPAYSVSSHGRVRRDTPGGGAVAGRILRFNPTITGYLMVQLWRESKPHPQLVHRLVAKAFLGEPEIGQTDVAHFDGDRSNNNPSNLRWATRAENMKDAVRHGTSAAGSRNPMSKLCEGRVRYIKWRLSQGYGKEELAKAFSVSKATIAYIARGDTWRHV